MNVHDVPLRQAFTAPSTASLVALSGIPLVMETTFQRLLLLLLVRRMNRCATVT